MNFKERFLELLSEKELNYNLVAKKTNIPVTTLSNYINRGSTPSLVQLEVLADFFNCSIDYLAGREDDFGNVVSSAGNGAELSRDEKELLRLFNRLGPFEREAIVIQMEALAKNQPIKK